MSDHSVWPASSGYRLNDVGWLQFQRVCALVLAAETGVEEPGWVGHADRLRRAVIDGPVTFTSTGASIQGPVEVLVGWVGQDTPAEERASSLATRMTKPTRRSGATMLVLTNLGEPAVSSALAERQEEPRAVVLGGGEIGAALDRYPAIRAAMPSVLGVRDLSGLLSPAVVETSSLHLETAAALARVFWPTHAYEQARRVLAQHRFVVLTGPPEMGKTAIAQMLALAQMTDGWEAYECTNPAQLWRSFEAGRRQVFVADDAFGSTEYRPEAAEHWAQSLGRLLPLLDDEHWLIWTSRPAPLKAGLLRVQRERYAERFPAPAEVLVDAGSLDLAEKTLILFRHTKARGLSDPARQLVRSSALTLVEHPHFTPERIRRLVSDRLDGLQHTARRHGRAAVEAELRRELSTPTEAMRTSYRALGSEHRELLIALLDAPAGLIDERDLAAALRRHHPGGLSRPPGELIDRLTDHFLRVTALGIGWVHPSWRDLVIAELSEDPSARRRFIAASGLYGMMLALSRAGGVAGERSLPLITDDQDWDAVGDRLVSLACELENHEMLQLFLALRGLRELEISRAHEWEARNLTVYVLGAAARRWDQERRVLPSPLLEAWYDLRDWGAQPVPPPSLTSTWAALHPGSPTEWRLERAELLRLQEWLTLIKVLRSYDPDSLDKLGFPTHDEPLLVDFVPALQRGVEDLDPLTESILGQLQDLGDGMAAIEAARAREEIGVRRDHDRRWWTPEDIAAPPSHEPVSSGADEFTRNDVDRVLADL